MKPFLVLLLLLFSLNASAQYQQIQPTIYDTIPNTPKQKCYEAGKSMELSGTLQLIGFAMIGLGAYTISKHDAADGKILIVAGSLCVISAHSVLIYGGNRLRKFSNNF